MSDINITADISDLITKTAQMLNLTNAQVAALNAYTNATVKWNNTGQGSVATLTAQISATQTLNATIKETANGIELVTAKVVQNNKRVEAAQRAAAQAAKEAARAQTDAAKAAAKAAEDAAKRVQAARAKTLAEDVQRTTQREQTRVVGIGGGGFSGDSQAKLLGLAKTIGELGAKSGLTTKQLQDMFDKISRGDLSGIEAKYAKLVQAVVRYNGIIEGERNKIAKSAFVGGAAGLPGPSSDVLGKLKDYFGLLNRISSTLTNLAIYRGFNILTNNLTQSITAAREYQVQVGLIRTISQDAQLSAEGWATGLRSVSNALGIEFNDVAKAAYDTISNQIAKGEQTFAFLTEAGQLAKTTGTNIRDSADVISSVINSYNLSADRAGEISAKLFATIDRGRIVMSEFQGTIGRVTFLANDLGVSMDEVLAILATLTRNGIKTSDAITLLNNGMQKLTKPTEAATKFINELGFATPRAAVGVLGLTKTLQELISGVQSGRIDATDIFNEARSERFFAGIRGNLNEVTSDLDYISNRSGVVYENAKKIVEETDANRINTAITTFKNALATTAGDAFNSAVVGFFNLDKSAKTADERMQSITETARNLFRIMVSGGAAIGSLVLVIKGLSAAQTINGALEARRFVQENAALAQRLRAAGLTTQAIALENQLAAARARSAAAGGLGALAGSGRAIGALGVTAAVGYLAYKSTQTDDQFSATAEAADDLIKRVRAEELNRNLQRSVDLAREMKKGFDETAQSFGRIIAEASRINNVRIGDLREEMKGMAAELEQLFDGIQELSRQPIQELESELSRLKSISDAIKKDKRTDAGSERAQAGLFSTANRFANPQQQLQLINNEYNRLDQRIRVLLSRNTAESLEEARSLQDRKLTLLQQYYEKEGELQQKQFEESTRAAVAQGLINPGDFTFQYDQSRQVAATNRELARQAALNDRIQQQITTARRAREEELAKAKAEEAARRKAVDDFTKFDVYTPQGAVKEQFRGSNGQLDQAKALAELQRLSAVARDALGSDATSRLQGEELIQRRAAQQRELILRSNAQSSLNDVQRRGGEAQRELTERLNAGETQVRSYNQAVTQLVGELGTLTRSFGETAGAAGGRFEDAFLRSGNFLASNTLSREINRARLRFQAEAGTSERGVAVKEAEDKLAVLQQRAAALDARIKDLPNQKTTIEGREVIDPQKVAEVTQEARLLQAALASAADQLGRAYGVEGGAGIYLNGTQQALSSTIETLDNFDRRFGTARQGLANGIQTITLTTAAMNDLRLQTEAVNLSLTNLNTGIAAAVNQTGAVTEAQIANLQKLGKEADNVLTRMEQIARGRTVIGPDGQIVPIQPAQQGGIIPPRQGRAYGGPIGHDNIPTWLTQGEYVVNAAATRKYYSQIASFNNQARVPQYFNQGGEVTNMGGVNINVYETKNPQQTAREVNRMLKRAKRQGTI